MQNLADKIKKRASRFFEKKDFESTTVPPSPEFQPRSSEQGRAKDTTECAQPKHANSALAFVDVDHYDDGDSIANTDCTEDGERTPKHLPFIYHRSRGPFPAREYQESAFVPGVHYLNKRPVVKRAYDQMNSIHSSLDNLNGAAPSVYAMNSFGARVHAKEIQAYELQCARETELAVLKDPTWGELESESSGLGSEEESAMREKWGLGKPAPEHGSPQPETSSLAAPQVRASLTSDTNPTAASDKNQGEGNADRNEATSPPAHNTSSLPHPTSVHPGNESFFSPPETFPEIRGLWETIVRVNDDLGAFKTEKTKLQNEEMEGRSFADALRNNIATCEAENLELDRELEKAKVLLAITQHRHKIRAPDNGPENPRAVRRNPATFGVGPTSMD